jgi:hypothetical protein
VVRRGTTCLCGSDRRAPDRRAGPRRAVRRLVTILRREAAAGVSAALLHLADACCPADVAVPPVLPAGKEPRNFGLHRVKPRGRPPAHRHHPAAAECCAQADHPPDQGVNAPYRSPNRAGPRRPHWSTPERAERRISRDDHDQRSSHCATADSAHRANLSPNTRNSFSLAMSPNGAHIFLFCAPAARIIGRRFTRPCVRVVHARHIAALLVPPDRTCAL